MITISNSGYPYECGMWTHKYLFFQYVQNLVYTRQKFIHLVMENFIEHLLCARTIVGSAAAHKPKIIPANMKLTKLNYIS